MAITVPDPGPPTRTVDTKTCRWGSSDEQGDMKILPSPVRWLTDEQFSNLPLPERMLQVAASQVGVTEETGRNDGEVDKYLVTAGMGVGSGLPYCAAGAYWCAEQAGAAMGYMPQRGLCAAVRNWRAWTLAGIHEFQWRRHWLKPKRGRLFYWLNDGRGHIGFVVRAFPGFFRTIEFNSNGEGAREGQGVVRRTRWTRSLKRNQFSGFIDLSDPELDGLR